MPAPTRLQTALVLIHQNARPTELAGMARFGIGGEGRLGLSVPAMRGIARVLGREHALALALWDTSIPDARIVAALVAEPVRLTSRQMDAWVKGFASWDVCDQTCLNAFCDSPLAWRKVKAWSGRQDEFVRRAAFALLATLAVHDKQASDAVFIDALVLVEAAAGDQRKLVRKAVNWALRNIGKRNPVLHRAAVDTAQRIRLQGSTSARWIAADALRELASPAVQKRLQAKTAPH